MTKAETIAEGKPLMRLPCLCLLLDRIAMEMKPHLLLRISLVMLLLHFLYPILASPEGFISIDCGGGDSAPYKDKNGIYWTPDSSFMSAGVAATVKNASLLASLSKPLTTLRYFPKAESKYCYALRNVQIGHPYLIRAIFVYGNYDGQNHIPIAFDLLLDAEVWESVVISKESPITYEIYVLANSSFISVCLAHSQSTDPFISTLELRPLNSNMSPMYWLNNRHVLYKWWRVNYGSQSNDVIRYPDDTFDRIWDPSTISPSTVTTQTVSSDYYDQPPSAVMMTAYGNDITPSLELTATLFAASYNYFILLYFAEIGNATMAGQRVFNITVNGEKFYQDLDVFKLADNEKYRGVDIKTNTSLVLNDSFNLLLAKLRTSSFGPLLCALEVFRISEQAFTANTLEKDVLALADVIKSLNMTDWIGDPCLPPPYTHDWLTCSSTVPPRIISLSLSKRNLEGSLSPSINQLTELTQISLDGNNLTGSIPTDLSQLKNLEKLDLQNNKLTGPIPESLAKLPNLAELLLQNNDLSGAVSDILLQKSTNSTFNFQFQGNNKLCNIGNATCSSGNGKKSKKSLVIPLAVSAVVVSVVGVCAAFFFFAKSKQASKERNQTAVGDPRRFDVPSLARYFTYEEVQIATKNFSDKIGQGSFGEVFYGVLSNGEQIAAKVLSKQSRQGLPEFVNENVSYVEDLERFNDMLKAVPYRQLRNSGAFVDILSRVHHKNLVSLIGHCNYPERILIFEYMAGGNLKARIHGEGRLDESFNPLPWKTRLRIALDAAQGLEYLHTGCKPSIIHRDVKSSNLLLDDKLQAKVADFGLSRFKLGSDVSHVSTQNVVGTPGYLDPEYHATFKLTDKSDVYSFGVVILELISGRSAVETFRLPSSIVEWVRPFLLQQGNIEDVVDPALGKGYNLEAMWKVAEVAISSTERQSVSRPTMGEVVSELKEALRMEMGGAYRLGSMSKQQVMDEDKNSLEMSAVWPR